ncbi:MAG: Fe-S cluster assembly sulfur transfer protein SufU [Pseudomonadota bacterium]
MALDQLYQQLILEHNRSPRNFGPLAGVTHSARGLDALCGDDMLLELRVEGGKVVDAAFSGETCAVTRASASLLTDWLPGRDEAEVHSGFESFKALLDGKAVESAHQLGDFQKLDVLGRFPSRRRNAELPWRCAIDALRQVD